MQDVLKLITCFLFICIFQLGIAQQLHPGFDKKEFEELTLINTTLSESKKNRATMPLPKYSKLAYSSPAMGLDNKWELWMKDENVAVIVLRGSTAQTESWLANLFAVQIPAVGELTIEKDFTFSYKLGEHPKAAVHAGYVFSSAFLMRDILPKVDSLYKKGVKDVIITGHSQGGGLAYIIGANLLWRQKDNLLPQDIRFKIYSSAGPKPGNLYFSFDYARVTTDGWAYQVVNIEDWVPQTPFAVQTVDDFPAVNPMTYIQSNISEQSVFKKIILKSVFRKITKPPFKAVSTYQKYLGDLVGKKIKKDFKDFELPTFSTSNEYIRAGQQVLLFPNEAYFEKFNAAENPNNFMLHHSLTAYYYLLLNNDL